MKLPNLKKLKKMAKPKNLKKLPKNLKKLTAEKQDPRKKKQLIVSLVSVLVLLAIVIPVVIVNTRPEWATSATVRRNRDYFASWKKLENVTIKSSVTSIRDQAFFNCNKIKTIDIPDSVESIGEEAFKNCSSLTDVTVGTGLKVIARGAFDGCDNLKLTQYDNAKYLARGKNPYAILVKAASSSITSCVVHKDTEIICYGAFSGCSKLTSLTVEAGNTFYHDDDNCIIQTKNKILAVGCKTSIIPTDGSVTSIGANAFSSCVGLEEIVIPGTVKSLGWASFQGCIDLKTIVIPASVTTIDNWTFYDCRALKNINYGGTKAQWEKIEKVGTWIHSSTGNFTVHCTDGDIAK